MPFSNARQLNRHFAEHGSEFGAATPQDYEQMADLFLKAPQSLSIRQCRRARGDLIRFDPVSGAYGVLDQNNNVRTFSGRFHAPRWQLRNLLYFSGTAKDGKHVSSVRIRDGRPTPRLQYLSLL